MKDNRDKQMRQSWKLLCSCSLGDAEGKMELKFETKADAERALAELRARGPEFGDSISINDSKMSSKRLDVGGIFRILDQKVVEAKLVKCLEDGVICAGLKSKILASEHLHGEGDSLQDGQAEIHQAEGEAQRQDHFASDRAIHKRRAGYLPPSESRCSNP